MLCELRVGKADLEELGGCLDGVSQEDQVLCEGRERVKETGGGGVKMRVRERLLELDRKMGWEREKRAIRSVR